MNRYTYDCESAKTVPAVRFQIVIKAASANAAACAAGVIGQAHGLLLIGPLELRYQEIYQLPY